VYEAEMMAQEYDKNLSALPPEEQAKELQSIVQALEECPEAAQFLNRWQKD
jgi:hypothetical protein